MPFHIFRHIQADHGVAAAKVLLRQDLGQLCLPHTCTQGSLFHQEASGCEDLHDRPLLPSHSMTMTLLTSGADKEQGRHGPVRILQATPCPHKR